MVSFCSCRFYGMPVVPEPAPQAPLAPCRVLPHLRELRFEHNTVNKLEVLQVC
jgi:hypothetical protein